MCVCVWARVGRSMMSHKSCCEIYCQSEVHVAIGHLWHPCTWTPNPFTHTHQTTALIGIYLAWEIGIVTKFLVQVPSRFITVKPTYPLLNCLTPFNAQWLYVKQHNYRTWNGDHMSVPFSLAVTSQVVLHETFGTHRLIFCLMLVHWRMQLSIQVVMMGVLGVLDWWTTDSTQPQWLTTLEPLLVPGLALSVMRAVGMDWIQQSLRESAKAMDYGLEAPSYVVCPYFNV